MKLRARSLSKRQGQLLYLAHQEPNIDALIILLREISLDDCYLSNIFEKSKTIFQKDRSEGDLQKMLHRDLHKYNKES